MATKAQLTVPTRRRYRWMLDHHIAPTVGTLRLDRLRPEDLDDLYTHLRHRGGRRRRGLSAKTVLEVHRLLSNALDLAVDRHLIDHNPAHHARPPRPERSSPVPAIWTAQQLADFLGAARSLRLYPALHLVAHTGVRRGELAGLNWGDLDRASSSLSIARTRQIGPGGRIIEAPVKTRNSRRRVDLDSVTLAALERWEALLAAEGAILEPSTPMFLNRQHQAPSPESFSQLFTRTVKTRTTLPRIRFHDLRHTHASLLVAAGVPIKVVSERLGHAHPGFTMHTYQHLLPGMGADAVHQFAQLVRSSR